MVDWTADEIDEAVTAYVAMLREEWAGRAYNKSDFRRAALAGRLIERSEGAFERRMQNITAVLRRAFGVEGIRGYVPLARTGIGQGATIRTALLRQMPELVRPLTPGEFERRIGVSRTAIRDGIPNAAPPAGNPTPRPSRASTTRYDRDFEVHAWILENANGRCEACDREAPFDTAAGNPYLEVHHLVQLAFGGPDVVENTLAVCPNCHREAHHGADPAGWIELARARVARLRPG